MLKKSDKTKFAKLVKQNKVFVVGGHQAPDGDVVGSTLALALGLKSLGKKVFAYNNDKCPEILSFLPGSQLLGPEIPRSFKNPVLITVDSGDLQRLGEKLSQYKFKEIWNVDHHKSNTRFGVHNFIDVDAGSTGQVVHDLLTACPGFKMSKNIAQNIYCTLSTDTGSFKYSNATPEVFNLAAKLVAAGAEPAKISQALYETYPARRLFLLQKVLQSLKFELEGRLAIMVCREEDLASANALSEDTDEFVNLPRGVKGVKIVCFLKEKSKVQWKISFRSRDGVPVLKLAQKFGGGGHNLAAGATADMELRPLLEAIINNVKEVLGSK